MTVETKLNFDSDYITQYSQKRGEPSWLLDLRLTGLEQSETLPLPKPDKTRITDWNLLDFAHVRDAEAISGYDQLPEDVKSMLGAEEATQNILVHHNAHPVYQRIHQDLKDKGVILTDFATAAKKHSELLQTYLHQLVSTSDHRIRALHRALINCGVFVYVPKNVEVDVPIQSVFWQTDANVGTIPHILIVAEDNSKVTYIENSFDAASGQSVNNYVAEVFVGQGARVTFAAVDNLSEQRTSYIERHAQVERDGRIEWALGQMNSGNTISDNTTYLKGDGSTGDTKSVVVGKGEQSQNFVQRMVQAGLSTDGQMLSHGVMKDASTAIFNGITKIEKGSTKSNGEQTERVLMLSEKARGDANPILLIDEDDVTAGHAASVGQINPMQLYYLMSRGLSRPEAERLIIIGFLAPVIEQIPLEGMKKRLTDVIERKIRV